LSPLGLYCGAWHQYSWHQYSYYFISLTIITTEKAKYSQKNSASPFTICIMVWASQEFIPTKPNM